MKGKIKLFGFLFIASAILLMSSCAEVPIPPVTAAIEESLPQEKAVPVAAAAPVEEAVPVAEAAPTIPPAPAAIEESQIREESVPVAAAAPVETAAPKGAKEYVKNPAVDSVESNYAVVRVYFGTDRNYKAGQSPTKTFGKNIGDFSYGTCEVSIPRDHIPGELETPSILRFEFKENPKKHVSLLKIDKVDKDVFFSELNNRCNKLKSKKAFVFVHGFNVSFHNAAIRTAQMAYDLSFDGPAIFYSWPSKLGVKGYNKDSETIEIEKANGRIRQFLEDIASQSGANEIFLIAHSMGSRLATDAFFKLEEGVEKYNKLILSAPDINREIFMTEILPKFNNKSRSVTIYSSSNDWALKASKKINGWERIGDSDTKKIFTEGLEYIDASNVKTDFLGHSYFAEDPAVISDIHYNLQGISPHKRSWLDTIISTEGIYWRFRNTRK